MDQAPGGADGSWESAEAVVTAAGVAGYDVTRHQLIRWHKAGILERPRLERRGRKGTTSLYPAGTGQLVIDFCALGAADRRLAERAFQLWWEGMPVGMKLVRRMLEKVALGTAKTLAKFVSREGEPNERADTALQNVWKTDLDQQTLRWIRKRVGSGQFDLVLENFLRLVGGGVARLSDDDLEEMDHALGFDQARRDVLAGTGKPWLEGDRREDFKNISRANDPALHLQMLEEATDVDLCLARDQLRSLATMMAALGSVVRDTAGRWTFGLGAHGAFMEEAESSAQGRAQMILGWLALNHLGFTDGIRVMLEEAPKAQTARLMLNGLQTLCEEIPAAREVLSERRLKRYLSDPATQEQINAGLRDLRRQLPEEFEAFFLRHPEYCLSSEPPTSG